MSTLENMAEKISDEVQHVELFKTSHVLTHAYVAPFLVIYAIFFPTWIIKFGFFENFEIGCIFLAILGVIQVLVCLACLWSVHIQARFTCSKVLLLLSWLLFIYDLNIEK